MEVGDKVYIVNDSERSGLNTGYYPILKVGRKYFELEYFWEKFLIKVDEFPYNRGVRTRDDYNSSLYWYNSEEEYNKIRLGEESRQFIKENIHLMDADEAIDLANILKQKKNESKISGRR